MKILLSTTILASSLIASATAFAADTGKLQLEEIVVTAQKRAENVQDVPIAVTAFTADLLANSGITEVSQLANLTPNVILDAGTPFSGSGGVLAAYIRGIGQNDFAFNLDPGVGIYVDGVFLARTVGANTDLLDVERIEILKGPQGTLFGRNSIGGAVNIVTREPGEEFSFRADITTGSYNRLDIKGTADIPLIQDKLFSSVSFSSKKKDGFQKRIPFASGPHVTDGFTKFKASGYNTADREGDQNEWTLRGKILAHVNEDVKLTISADYTKVNQAAIANTVLQTTANVPGPFAGNPVTEEPGFLFAGLYNFCIGADTAEIAVRGATQICGPRGTSHDPSLVLPGLASVNVDADPFNDRLPYDDRFVTDNIDESYANGNSFSRMQTYGFSGVVDWSIDDNMSLKSITAYRELHWVAGMDLDGSPLDILHTSFEMNQKQFSQELQLTGIAFDDRLDYVFGAYYFEESGDLHDYVTFPAGLLQIDGPNDLATSAWAVFAHLNYKITDQFSVTFGGRYTEENKDFQGFQSDLNGFNYKIAGIDHTSIDAQAAIDNGFSDPSDPLRYFPPGNREKKFTNFSPRLGLEYRPNEDMMVYASFSKGYKTGSWTTRLSNPPSAADRLDFDEETADSYEVGFKSELFDRRAQINVAAFFTKYDNIQLNFQEGTSPVIHNAGNAEMKGFEIEFLVLATAEFTIRGGIGYTDADYTFINPLVAGITTDTALPKTPKFSLNISPRYELTLGNSGTLMFNMDYTHTSSLYNDTENTALIKRPAIDIVNASVTYREPGEHWEFIVGGKNILDKRYLVTGQAQIAGGLIYGTYNSPAEWSATLRVNF